MKEATLVIGISKPIIRKSSSMDVGLEEQEECRLKLSPTHKTIMTLMARGMFPTKYGTKSIR